MKRKHILLSTMLLLGIGMVSAQTTAFAYVQQNGAHVANDGTAAFDITDQANDAYLKFDEEGRNATMTIADVMVAKVPITDIYEGELAVDYTSSAANISESFSETWPYATIFSPFLLKVPEGEFEVYAPTYDAETYKLVLTDANKVAAGTVIPIGTGLVVKGEVGTTINFTFSQTEANDVTSVLSGSPTKITKSKLDVSGWTIYTLGHNKENTSQYGFYKYNGYSLNPGRAFLNVGTVPSSAGAKVSFFFDEATDITLLPIEDMTEYHTYKIVKDGDVVIVKNNEMYNLKGQKLK